MALSRALHLAILASASLLLAGCGQPAPDVPDYCAPEPTAGDAMTHDGALTMNECSGPQAQACVADQEEPLYFCSTSDLLDWQADSDREVHTTLTRDLSDVDWNPRDPGDWVAMDTAWYVVGHDRDNGQGQTPPVGFSDVGDAEIFASKHGGRITGYDGIAKDSD